MCVKLADLTTHSPAEDLRSPPHSDTPSPSTSDRPRNADARPQAVRCTPRRPHNPFPPKTFAHPRTATRPSRALPIAPSVLTHAHAAPTHARSARCIPRRPHNPFPAEDLRSPTQPRRMPAGCAMHARRPHNPFPAQRHAASPSVPLRAQKNGTAQCMCDAECLGRPSLRSVIWVGEPRAVRRRCGALACRHGA